MASRKARGPELVTAYNTAPSPVMVDSVGHLLAGSTQGVVDPADPITARLIERGTLIVKEGQ